MVGAWHTRLKARKIRLRFSQLLKTRNNHCPGLEQPHPFAPHGKLPALVLRRQRPQDPLPRVPALMDLGHHPRWRALGRVA